MSDSPGLGGWKQPCLRPRLGIPPCRSSGGGWKTRFISPWQDGILLPIPARGAAGMTLYGYARVSVREPEDKNLDLQVERLVRAGCSLGNIRAEEASGARNDRGGLLELLDLVVEGDTLVVTHIDRLSRGLTHGLQVIEGLHRAGVEFRSLSEDFDTGHGHRQAPAHDGARLQRVVAELDQGALGRGAGEGAGRGAVPWPAAEPERAATGVHPGRAVEGSEPAGTGQAPGGQPLDHPTGGQVAVGGLGVSTPTAQCWRPIGRRAPSHWPTGTAGICPTTRSPMPIAEIPAPGD